MFPGTAGGAGRFSQVWEGKGEVAEVRAVVSFHLTGSPSIDRASLCGRSDREKQR